MWVLSQVSQVSQVRTVLFSDDQRCSIRPKRLPQICQASRDFESLRSKDRPITLAITRPVAAKRGPTLEDVSVHKRFLFSSTVSSRFQVTRNSLKADIGLQEKALRLGNHTSISIYWHLATIRSQSSISSPSPLAARSRGIINHKQSRKVLRNTIRRRGTTPVATHFSKYSLKGEGIKLLTDCAKLFAEEGDPKESSSPSPTAVCLVDSESSSTPTSCGRAQGAK